MLDDELTPGALGDQKEPLTYGSYLRIPELLCLQSPLSDPVVHDEMLFIILQQAQELWFKQLLHEVGRIVGLLEDRDLFAATRLLERADRIIGVLNEEVRLMESLPPQEFQRFRHVLTSSSGFESEQFREFELASGLNDATFVRLLEKHLDMPTLKARWPRSLHDAWLSLLEEVSPDPVDAVVRVYNDPRRYPELYALAEALSEYEVLFSEWRFHHVKVVERTIGDHAPGTAGSSGVGYLGKTLGYRFFPELWEARNYITAQAASGG